MKYCCNKDKICCSPQKTIQSLHEVEYFLNKYFDVKKGICFVNWLKEKKGC